MRTHIHTHTHTRASVVAEGGYEALNPKLQMDIPVKGWLVWVTAEQARVCLRAHTFVKIPVLNHDRPPPAVFTPPPPTSLTPFTSSSSIVLSSDSLHLTIP